METIQKRSYKRQRARYSHVPGAYPCNYCHGILEYACTACDEDCDCIEIYNHIIGECPPDCIICKKELEQAKEEAKKEVLSTKPLDGELNDIYH